MTALMQMRSRDQVLNAAALRLLTGTNSTQLPEIRHILAPLACDTNEPEWIRAAIAAAVRILEEAEAGGVAASSAQRRVSALLELVSTGEDPQEDAATSHVFALPVESAREILPQFVAESLDCVAQAEKALLELEAGAANTDAVNVVLRAFHTIKGTSAFLGLERISTLTHDVESLLCGVRDGNAEFTARMADLSLACADMVRVLLAGADALLAGHEPETPAEYFALRHQLKAANQGVAEHPHSNEAVAEGTALAQSAPTGVEPPRAASAESWVRVRTERLDQVLDLVGELIVAQSMIVEDDAVQRDRHGTLARKVQQTSKIVRELQGLSMSLRMVPLRPLFQKLQRLVRDVAHSANKPVQLLTDGEETEIDRSMVEVVADPLVHMIRNAIDHGIESAAERAAAGKPATGTLHLKAATVGGAVMIELRDDGRGLDHARIVAAAVEKGMIESGRNHTSADIQELIFRAGLSTNTGVTELSGRGVGMDVVRKNVEALHGRVEITSAPSEGTTFTIRLPLTLAITDGMLVRVGKERYILQKAEIQTSFRPRREDLATVGSESELVMLHGHALPVVRLHHVLDIDGAVTDPTRGLLVVLGEKERRYALLVDELLGQQQFVAKPIAVGGSQVPGVAGGAILGDGRVGLILDPAGLMNAARGQPPPR
jgi:two-component system chemotaxis sensor kinase CheA